jgi:predicted DNA-binding transcriptional regulator AlpA
MTVNAGAGRPQTIWDSLVRTDTSLPPTGTSWPGSARPRLRSDATTLAGRRIVSGHFGKANGMEQFKRDLMQKEGAAKHAAFLEFKRQIAERQLVDRRAAAKLLGVTLRTLRRWHEENRSPPRVSFGARKVYYAMPDILEYLDAKKRRRNKRPGRHQMFHEAVAETVEPSDVLSV